MKPMPTIMYNLHLRRLTAVLVLDILYFSFVTPSPSRSVTLLGGYILLFATFYTGLQVLLRVMRRVLGRPKSHIQRITIAGTLFGVVLVALQTVGQLSVRDILVVVAIAVLGYLYSVYLTPKQKR